MKVYDNYEISPCKRMLDSDAYPPEEYIEVCEEHEAEFWTLYGHIDGEGVQAIGDFRSREAAEQVYSRITGQPFTGSYQAQACLRVMHAGPKLLEAAAAAWRRAFDHEQLTPAECNQLYAAIVAATTAMPPLTTSSNSPGKETRA